MSPVVAECPIHGPFESRAFGVMDGQATFTGSTDRCPRCGRLSRVMEGRFSFDHQGFATLLSGPEWSLAALHKVQDAAMRARQALERGEPPQRALDLLDDSPGSLAKTLKAEAKGKGWDRNQVLTLINTLIATASMLIAYATYQHSVSQDDQAPTPAPVEQPASVDPNLPTPPPED